jgi:hypothetical protein
MAKYNIIFTPVNRLMKPNYSIPLLIGLSVVNPVSLQANTIDDDVLITQSPRQYKCTPNGVEPNVSGSILARGYYCYVPISAGKVIGIAPWTDYMGCSKYASGFCPANSDDVTVTTDEVTKKVYYKFSSGNKFLLQ